MKLSEHFLLIEFTRSQTASRHGIANTPNEEQIENLKTLAKGLEDVRTKLGGNPINISSGFRCEALNDRLGSKRTSRHILGLAADFTCDRHGDVDDVFSVLADSSIEFDQLILEYNSWIHIAFPKKGDKPQRQVLIINKEGVHFYG